MRVLIQHLVELPAFHYGGTERVMIWLARGLIEMGHDVGIVALPGSHSPYKGIKIYGGEAEYFSSGDQYDVFHFFTNPPPHWIEHIGNRCVATIQGNGQLGEKFHLNTVFVSRNHAKRHGSNVYVYNGLDPAELNYSSASRPDRYLFLSRTDWRVKNVRGAMSMCAKLRKNLWIAGGDGPLWARLKVQWRRSAGSDWRWMGSINQEQKAHFLTQGHALLFPILWNEPFGLVQIESLVSGTPVLANPFGSAPEVLDFAPQCLMRNELDWVNALTGNIQLPSPQVCRDWVMAHFTYQQMAKNYVRLYDDVLSGKTLNEKQPTTLITANDIT